VLRFLGVLNKKKPVFKRLLKCGLLGGCGKQVVSRASPDFSGCHEKLGRVDLRSAMVPVQSVLVRQQPWLTRREAAARMLFRKTEQGFTLRLSLQTFHEGKRENEL